MAQKASKPGASQTAPPEWSYPEYAYDLLKLLWWSEPGPPPASSATLEIGQPQTRVEKLLLRANVPSTVLLRGPADLLFQGYTIRLTARPLVRNLAKPEWGSTRSASGADATKQEILLAAPARIEAVGVRGVGLPATLLVEYKEGAYQTWITALPQICDEDTSEASGLHEQAVVTQAVQIKLGEADAEILLRSPSLPSRVALALGDDTPAQLFPAEMESGGFVTSRDLTAQINNAWRRGAKVGTAEVPLRITSATDGVVQVDLNGTWGRQAASAEFPLSLDGVHPALLETPWPFGEEPDALVSLCLTGRTEGGRRLGLTAGSPSFCVRCTERLELAQAFRLAGGEPPSLGREILAVWLMIPRPPESEERLLLRLAEGRGDPAAPAGTDLGSLEVTLPADAGAYTAADGGYWYRAALKKPVAVDGTQATSPLFVVAAGREAGSLMAHRSTGTEPGSALQVPTAAGAGISLVRNLDRTDHWEVQSFNRQTAHWLVDLELTPTPAEHASLLTLAYGTTAAAGLPLAGPGEIKLQTAAAQLPRPAASSHGATPVMTAVIGAAIRAEGMAQFLFSRSVHS